MFTIYRLLPTRLLSRCFGALAGCRWRPFKNLCLAIYQRLYKIDLSEAVQSDLYTYPSLDDFFVRKLKSGARQLQPPADNIISPVDGRIMEIGRIRSGQCLQVKGIPYTIGQLIGDDFLASHYASGIYANFYLAPVNYHRIHMPVAGELQHMSYIPGPLLPVKPSVIQKVPHVLAGNERVICEFATSCGSMLVILVGAMMVGSMEVSWHPHERINPKLSAKIQHWNYVNDRIALSAGDEIGCFHMGSAVVVIFNRPDLVWDTQLQAGMALQTGNRLAQFMLDPTNKTTEQ